MTESIRRVNRIVDELVRRELVNPPRYENGTIREPLLAARIYRRVQEPWHMDTRDAGDRLFWTRHIQSRIKYVTQHAKKTPQVSEEYIGELQRLADQGNENAKAILQRYSSDKFRVYHRVPTGNGHYALKEHDEVLVEENRRLKGQYRKRRRENARFEKYHGDIDTVSQLLGLADKDKISDILNMLGGDGPEIEEAANNGDDS